MRQNRIKKIAVVLLAVAATTGAPAQETPNNLKVSGYIQVQNQWGQSDASLKVGTPNENPEGSFNRFGIRRGRLKFVYRTGPVSGVFQLDMTEKGVGIKDAYLNVKAPWVGTMAFQAGVFNRPFGYEIAHSAAERESPERSTVSQVLFPEEQDLAAMLVLQAPKSSPLHLLKLEAGLFSGNGIAQENDDKRDFLGHLSAFKRWGRVSLGGGVSYYNGVRGREYFGADLQFGAGRTKLNAEFLTGQHLSNDFTGGYAMLIQGLGQWPVALAGKFDWFNLGTQDEIDTVGLGALWDFDPAMRLTAWYDRTSRDQSNVFTLRLQHKF